MIAGTRANHDGVGAMRSVSLYLHSMEMIAPIIADKIANLQARRLDVLVMGRVKMAPPNCLD
jgi:hypothetical protein